MSEQNYAAVLPKPHANPFEVRSYPIPTPDANEVVIRSYAVAVNPVDWKIQSYNIFEPAYPLILGVDVAGIVHSVGSNVSAFKPGDRVIAHADGLGSRKSENNGFQLYPKTTEKLVAKLPDSFSFAEGSVLPLGISTGASALYEEVALGLPFPQAGSPKKSAEEQVLLIWGGSGSMGTVGIQLAVASGITVATTASAHNHEYVKSLGAKYVFDYKSDSVVNDIVSALKGKKFVGVYESTGDEQAQRKSAEIASKLDGVKIVASTLPMPADVPEGVKGLGVFAISILQNGVADEVWGKFVPEALKDGSIKAKPEPLLIGKGLEKVQEGLNKNKAGVSAKKVVIEL